MKAQNKYCAIYTRKSSEEGLEQDFNSLDAQREACIAFIASQKSEGWAAINEPYDDGGYSGGHMERPALKKLLDDIKARKIHIVVVYKIDRLTRSLMDFAKLVEVFDGHGVTFVSVTQSFNTTTSMGRLTLNVLLSFAQFEREVTGERIRDKIAASKKKGMWMGGMIPIGYDRVDKKLVVNPADAETVRHIFTKYLELVSIKELKEHLDSAGHRSKVRITSKGDSWGGSKFSRGLLYKTLSNPIYVGLVRHKDKIYPGLHKAIIPRNIWDEAQNLLTGQSAVKRGACIVRPEGNLLKGLLFDKAGRPYSPVFTKKRGKQYRYYVSQNLIQLNDTRPDISTRLPAYEIETAVKSAIQLQLASPRSLAEFLKIDLEEHGLALKQATQRPASPDVLLAEATTRIVLDADTLFIKFRLSAVAKILSETCKVFIPLTSEDSVIKVPYRTMRSKYGTLMIEPDNVPKAEKDLLDLPPNELKNLVRGLIWRDDHFGGMTLSQIAKRERVTPRYISRLIERTFLLA